eukprot:2008974-Pyramimonas_sp.AAC.1
MCKDSCPFRGRGGRHRGHSDNNSGAPLLSPCTLVSSPSTPKLTAILAQYVQSVVQRGPEGVQKGFIAVRNAQYV